MERWRWEMLSGEMPQRQDTGHCCHQTLNFGVCRCLPAELHAGAGGIQRAQPCSDAWGHPGEGSVPLSRGREGVVEEVPGEARWLSAGLYKELVSPFLGSPGTSWSPATGPCLGACLEGRLLSPFGIKIAVIKPHLQCSSTKQKSKQWWLFAFINLQTMQLGLQSRERRERLFPPPRHSPTGLWGAELLFPGHRGRQQLGTTSQNNFSHGFRPGVKTGSVMLR